MKMTKKILAASMAGIMGVAAVGGTATAIVSSIVADAVSIDQKEDVKNILVADDRDGSNNGTITGTAPTISASGQYTGNLYYFGKKIPDTMTANIKLTAAAPASGSDTTFKYLLKDAKYSTANDITISTGDSSADNQSITVKKDDFTDGKATYVFGVANSGDSALDDNHAQAELALTATEVTAAFDSEAYTLFVGDKLKASPGTDEQAPKVSTLTMNAGRTKANFAQDGLALAVVKRGNDGKIQSLSESRTTLDDAKLEAEFSFDAQDAKREAAILTIKSTETVLGTPDGALALDNTEFAIVVAGGEKVTIDGAEVAGITDARQIDNATVLGTFTLRVTPGKVTVHTNKPGTSDTYETMFLNSSNKLADLEDLQGNDTYIFKGWAKKPQSQLTESDTIYTTAEAKELTDLKDQNLYAIWGTSAYAGYTVANPDKDIKQIVSGDNAYVEVTLTNTRDAQVTEDIYVSVTDEVSFTNNSTESSKDENPVDRFGKKCTITSASGEEITKPADKKALSTIITIGDIRFVETKPADTEKVAYKAFQKTTDDKGTSAPDTYKTAQEKAFNSLAAKATGNYYATVTVSKYTAPAPDAQQGAGPSVINANGEAGSIERILSAYKIDLGSIKNLFSASDFSKNKIDGTIAKIQADNDITNEEAVQVFFSVVFKTQWGQENIELTFLQKIILALYL